MVYAGLIFLLSSLPHFPEEVSPFIGYDKLAHFIEYYFFGILICRWLLNKKNHFVRKIRPFHDHADRNLLWRQRRMASIVHTGACCINLGCIV